MEFGRNAVMPACGTQGVSVLLVKTGHILGNETLVLRPEQASEVMVLMIADVVEVSAKLGLCGGVMH